MIFKKLNIKNIRSYKELEIQFPQGSVLLSGNIGAGKTSILLALQFALFGLQPGQKGASILRQGENEAEVILEIDIDGSSVILERTLKKTKQSITQEYNKITINGASEELSTSEMKNKVITLLDYPKEFIKKSNLLYKFTVYTPQEEMKEIIQERPEIRLDTLRHIFGIDRYKRIKENSQILIQKIKEAIKIKEVEINQINVLKERFTQETEKRIALSKEINNLKIEQNNLLKEKQESEEKLNQTQTLIQEKQKLDSELRTKQMALQGKKELRTRLEKEILILQNKIREKIDFSEDNLREVFFLLEKHKRSLEESNSKYLKINSQISVLNSKKENALELKEKVISLENCPTCFQSVGKEYKEKITKKTQFDIEDFERELEPKIIEKNQILKDIESEKRLILGYEQDKQLLERDKINFQYQKETEIKIKSDAITLDMAMLEITEIEDKINELIRNIELHKETEILFELQKQESDKINKNFRLLEINLAEKNKESEILKSYLESLEKEIAQKEKIRTQINYLRELQDWLEKNFVSIITLTETNVLAKLRSEFSRIFSDWFSILVSDTLQVRLDEDFTPIITNQDYELDYDFLSGGERTAVALAYRLALNQVLNSLLSRIKTKDIVILDEPTDGFSEQQLDKMRDIFDQLNSKQIILVSHEQKIEGFVDNIIRIKKDGTSLIESVSG